GEGSLRLANKLVEVICEQTQIALSWVKGHAYKLGFTFSPSNVFLSYRDVHGYVPGSAGIEEIPSARTAVLVTFLRILKSVRGDSDIGAPPTFLLALTTADGVCPVKSHNRQPSLRPSVGGLNKSILEADLAGIKAIFLLKVAFPGVKTVIPKSVKQGIRIMY
ncbi:hypothetical protein BKA70DRAFT_1055232, partial [Coprinopsis sp. MPI-PUGE-AT-0042]